MKKEELLKKIANYYLESSDFNGEPVNEIISSNKTNKKLIEQLISGGLISINYGDKHPNSHILAFEPESIEIQLEKFKRIDLTNACLYPTKKYLSKIVNKLKYSDKPFVLMMALGEPQLSFKAFDLSVLETYRNDPRYSFNCDDIQGNLSITSGLSENDKIYKRDNVFLQTFGFAYNKTLTKRTVAVYIRYLADLSPEHQQYWFNKMLKGKYILHPAYYATTMGSWDFNESIFNAFIEELHHINAMSVLMGKPKLFLKEYSRESKPKNFSFLLRPTLKEFNEFTLLLDILMSDNLNKDFFKDDLILENEETINDGRIKVTPKGTISLLEEWLNRVHFPAPNPKTEMLNVFRQVRKLRQSPAHTIHDDTFNQKFFIQQRKLIIDAYKAIRTLRLIFTNHPKVKGYNKVPDWLYKGEISTF